MQHQIQALLNDLKTLVLSHPTVHQMHLCGEEVTVLRGYLRMRLVLQSQDIVEIFVYLIDERGVIRLRDYSLHWQRADGTLVQRWDTAPHRPELATFPSHIHKTTGEVEPTTALDWNGLVSLLHREVLVASDRTPDA